MIWVFALLISKIIFYLCKQILKDYGYTTG